MYNKEFMNLIIQKAKEEKKDIPVCALISRGSEIISIKINKKEQDNDVTSHAEILAIKEASKKLNNWRLEDCDIYVTLEPCPMCGWAIISSRFKNLYFGSYDYKYGAFSTGLNLKAFANSTLNIEGGKKEAECDKILKDYFESLRYEKTAG